MGGSFSNLLREDISNLEKVECYYNEYDGVGRIEKNRMLYKDITRNKATCYRKALLLGYLKLLKENVVSA